MNGNKKVVHSFYSSGFIIPYIRNTKLYIMKYFLFVCSILILAGCNSSTSNNADNNSDIDSKSKVFDAEFMKPKQINADALPSEVSVYGIFNEAWIWVDSLGENLFVLSHQIKKEDQKNEDGEDVITGSAYTSHYLKKDGRYRSSRTSNQDERSCAYDMVCDFIPGSTTITDLDNNGFAEMKYQVIMACRSDVSPAAMHLKMRENEKSYVLIGTTWVPFKDGLKFNLTTENLSIDGSGKVDDELLEMERTMGKYIGEYQFSNAPPQFLQYARQEWLKYVKEKMGE